MREGLPSATAARVAAYRLGFERLPAPFGDPSADEGLAADVAAGLEGFAPSERVGHYLRARTSFFDRVAVNAIERGAAQIVVIGAGYDGRALRYASDGVRWFEIDHPDTQSDKRERLERLDIDTRGIAFVGLDLREGGLGGMLVSAGFNPDAPAVTLCEGVAVYLEDATLEALLCELRALATPGTRLTLSVGPSLPASGDNIREQFSARVAALGEPVSGSIGAGGVAELLDRARWRKVEVPERAERAGFVVSVPVWRPAVPPAPKTLGRIGGYMERTFHRDGADTLVAHLQSSYDIEIKQARRLDVGVHRVDLRDGRRWIARIFPSSRPVEAARYEVTVLRALADAGYPAERCAHPEPISTHKAQTVVVTDHLAGKTPAGTQATFRTLGDLLGRLHSMPTAPGLSERSGGAWHHLASGGPEDEVAAALNLLDDASPWVPASKLGALQTLREELLHTEDCSGLPKALVHPDFVPANALSSIAGQAWIVDWAGTGWGPRLWSLSFLLWAAGARSLRCVDAVVAGYRSHVELQSAELDRLAGAVAARPLVLDVWSFATGRKPLSEVVEQMEIARTEASSIAARARSALGKGPESSD